MIIKHKQKLLPFLFLIFTASCGGNYNAPYYPVSQVNYNQQNNCTCNVKKNTDTKTTVKKSEPEKPTTKTEEKETKPVEPVNKSTETKKSEPVKVVKDKSREILNSVLTKISSAKAFKLDISKTEKSLDSSETVENTVDFYFKQPNQVKVEVRSHSTNSMAVGSKVAYISGSGRVKVKAGGVLGVFPLELDMTDKQVVSVNKYTPDETDLLSLAKRFKSLDYKPELTGKTTMNGKEVLILKITATGTNTLDSRIKYEQIGFEKDTLKLVMWETYSSKSDSPYMSVNIKSFEILDSIPDDKMKL